MSFYDKMRRQKFLSFTVILFTLSTAVVIGTLAQSSANAQKGPTAAPDATPLTIPNETPLENDFTRVAKALEPEVVNINIDYIPKTSSKAAPQRNPRGQQPNGDDDDQGGLPDFFQRFFGQGGGGLQFGQPEDVPTSSLGSGVVVDRNGYILTNNHVVEKATRIRVQFMNDTTQYPATVVGTDKETDLAVIHVDRHGLATARIGNSDVLQPGDWVVAIGSPFGFRATVTAGIVSAISRDIPDEPSTFQHFIQTDAAINPGNSGGPLANIKGEVVGINTMIASRSGGYQGIGFAMPINTAVKVYNEIIKAGHMTRGSIGIQFPQEVNPALLKVYGADHGIFVQEVVPDGPAQKAGVKEQDILTSINGKPIYKGQDLIDMVADSSLGSTLKVGIIRDKKPMTLDIVVGDRNKVLAATDGEGPTPEEPEAEPSTSRLKFGMSVQPMTQGLRQTMGFKGTGGVLIQSVDPGSFADDINLAKGDVIVELNRQKINTPADIQRIQAGLKPGDAVAFQVMRQAQGRNGGGEWTPVFAAGTVPANNQ